MAEKKTAAEALAEVPGEAPVEVPAKVPAESPAEAPAETADQSGLLGSCVKSLLGYMDKTVLGVAVELGSVNVSPLQGKVEVQGLTVRNPEGYSSPHLLKAQKLTLHVRVGQLVLSGGTDINVEEITLEGVDFIFEKAAFTSNLNDVIAKVSGPPPASTDAAKQEEKKEEKPEDKASDTKMALHKVSLRGIGGKITSTLVAGLGPTFVIGDIVFDDFDKEATAGRGVKEAICLFFGTIFKSLLSNVMGRENMTNVAGDTAADKKAEDAAASDDAEDGKLPPIGAASPPVVMPPKGGLFGNVFGCCATRPRPTAS